MSCLIALPTRPLNDSGAPHILEHLSLCANRRFPVRNAFFGMQQRSMASFMNAMTGEDITYYPFATPNEKDFFHLLEVYVNAVFFPNLDRLDFLQEGWRHTLDEKGELGIDGVVFNEMKGALANADRLYQHRITRALHPGTQRVHLAGGDPLSIPDLTHEDLCAFHAENYHPSRAVVVTYGNLNPLLIQERLNTWVLDEIWPAPLPFSADKSRLASPTRTDILIGVQQSPEHEHKVTRAWIIEGGEDPVARLEAEVMIQLLFGEGAPLSSALDGAGFGRPGAMGMATDGVDMEAHIGMNGLTAGQVEQAESLINAAIERVATEGVEVEQIEAVFRHVEMAQRDISGSGGLPFGVSLSIEAASAVLHGQDPFQSIDHTAAIKELRNRLREPHDVALWVQNNLRDNVRRVDAHGVPDPLFFERRQRALDERLKRDTESLTDEQRATILADMKSLEHRQSETSHDDCLPFVSPMDVPITPPPAPSVIWTKGSGLPQATVCIPSNGIIRLGVTLDVGHLSPEDIDWVDTAAWLLLQVGVEGMDWEQAGRWRNSQVGAFNTGLRLIQKTTSPREVLVHANFDVSALERNSGEAIEVIRRTLEEGRMDEIERITHLIVSRTDSLIQKAGVIGDSIARTRAMAHTRPTSALLHLISGPDAVRDQIERRNQLARGESDYVFENLRKAMENIRTASRIIRVDGENPQTVAKTLAHRLTQPPRERSRTSQVACPTPAQTALVADTAVNYVWQAFRGPESGHPGAAAAAVMARMLSHEVLHTSIREKGGAYGGGLHYQAGGFAFSSYRDPRLAGTFADFQHAIDFAADGRLAGKGLDEAILSVLRDSDAPGSPHSLAQRAWTRDCQGWTVADQTRYREQVRGTTLDEVARTAQEWLVSEESSRVVFTHPKRQEEAEKCGLIIESLFVEPSAPIARVSRKPG